jgi:Ni/Co efflux regulator RcnB
MKRIVMTIAAVAMLALPAGLSAQQPKNLQIGPNNAEVKFGGTVTLSGKLTGQNNSGRNVTVERDPFPFAVFEAAGSTQTNSSGDWSFADKPTVNTRYRARSQDAESKTVDVNVRPAIGFRLSDRTPAVRQRVRFSGRLCPEHDGTAVALQQRLPNGQWRSIRTLVLKDIPGETCSSYARTLRPHKTRAYRVHFNGDADHVAGNSRVRVARVH